jgi:Ca2+-transporting ATPase
MGERGTDVARQAADLVLTDDQLRTVVAAVEEGRRVFANIRRFLLYGLSGGGSEVVLMLAGPFVGIPVPLLPAQILWVNLLTHSFAGAGLGAQPADPAAMGRPPRPPSQAVLGDGLWWRLLVLAGWLGGASLAASAFAGPEVGRSVALVCLGAGQLAVAWASRGPAPERGIRRLTADPLAGGLALAALLLLASVGVPALRDLLGTHALTVPASLLVVAVALFTYLVARIVTPRTW